MALHSSRRVSRLAAQHSASNLGSEGRGRLVTVRAGVARSSMVVSRKVMPLCQHPSRANDQVDKE